MATETVGSVAEMGYRGVDQWVMVRGKSLLLRGRRDRWVPAETSRRPVSTPRCNVQQSRSTRSGHGTCWPAR
jgi:hypothetical protein